MAEKLTIRPLTQNAFAPFGTVIEADPATMRHINGGNTERYHALAEAEAVGEDAKVVINLFRGSPRAFPYAVDMMERHPFDVEILRIPPGKIPYPYHSHSAQWEFYHVISGHGLSRDAEGTTPIEPGDAFLFKPGEPHQQLG